MGKYEPCCKEEQDFLREYNPNQFSSHAVKKQIEIKTWLFILNIKNTKHKIRNISHKKFNIIEISWQSNYRQIFIKKTRRIKINTKWSK